MHPNAQVLQTFYTAFQRRDAAGMAACYHPEVVFTDPVFPDLRGREVGAMWAMLCARAKDFALTFDVVSADDAQGAARWEARYSFSDTGRPVINQVTSAFTFRDGLILNQQDTFDLWRWTRMALGLQGVLLGWAPFVQSRIRRQARGRLDAYMRKQS